FNSTASSNSAEPTGVPPQLWHVSANPTAGMGFVRNTAGLMLYFVERATGYVFAADMNNGKLTRLSNTLRAKTYDALFPSAGFVIVQSRRDSGTVKPFAATLPMTTAPNAAPNASSTPSELGGTALEDNIMTIAVNPAAREYLYLVAPQGSAMGIRSLWD